MEGVQKALDNARVGEVRYAYDAITGHNSFLNISKVLAKKGSKMVLVLPNVDFSGIPEYIQTAQSAVASIFQVNEGERNLDQEFGLVYFRWFWRALKDGLFRGHPFEIVPGGLNGVEKGLKDLKAGKNKATKYIFQIGEVAQS